ncbi:hypothetical protein [Deminuibacter soli]|nr:hypothetical protein [Deminuibacter soli]
MPKAWLALFLLISFSACKGKKTAVSGDAPVKTNDFLAAFPTLTLPFQAADTNVQKLADTTVISHKVMSQFVPDSVVTLFAGKDTKTKIHPIGKIDKGSGELYLLANFSQGKKTKLVAFVLDKKDKYITALPLLSNSNDDGHRHYVNINREPTFTIGREKISAENQLLYTRNGYAFNSSAAAFIAITNETNEDAHKNTDIINPIDTLPRKNKYSGEYAENKKNFISIRDGRNASTYQFFLHFEKNDGQCTGELKGELVMRDDRKAIFHENGDPCVIDFTFSSSDIIIKEQGSCGNHRGMRCQFNDTYRKKKEKKKGSKV